MPPQIKEINGDKRILEIGVSMPWALVVCSSMGANAG